ncbi:RHS repeat-associated core domain-containing protein [Elizabethkingia anophelis]|uniref:RHS repeat-associated core domain-containing protein n=1 Tax=Elizabethkingia anophelis TaxID=1117645 RepID=UPI000401BD07|nr:RHS repeat-associated core domain-containing protein [Elizabethkingia anophelis]MDC8026598.1 hypothetical protein [Elizabethkingia anophelis]
MTTIEATVCTEYYSAGSGIIKMYATIKVPDTLAITPGKYRLMNGNTIVKEDSFYDFSRSNGEIGLSAMFDNNLTESELQQSTKFVLEATIEGVSKQLVLDGYNSVRCTTGIFLDPQTTNPDGTIPFHDTQGNIEVNGGGQLQYTLPIALPPGIKSVAPQINLVYTSGGRNGIAGYGWNISGITAISRTGKNLEKDGEIKGVQLDYSDFYQFNGERLVLKSGVYGKDGAEYNTEKYSNARIKSIGINPEQNGPAFFEVTFEDGSQAWYGHTDAVGVSNGRTPVEYNIVKWKDAQGNYIIYNYEQTDNVAIISNIQWGGNETIGQANFNSIVFNYNIRDLRETTYVKGKKFIQNKILANITVHANGKLFKSYTINYKKNGSIGNYQFISSISEGNSEQQQANAVSFEYAEDTIVPIEHSVVTKPPKPGYARKYADFNRDGEVDYLEYGAELLYKSSVYKDTEAIALSYDQSKFDTNAFRYASPIRFIDPSNKVKLVTGLAVPIMKPTLQDPYKYDCEINIFSVDLINKRLQYEFTRLIPYDVYQIYDEYTDTHPNPEYQWMDKRTYLAGMRAVDRNGDNIDELLLEFERTVLCYDFLNEGYPDLPPCQKEKTTYYRQVSVNLEKDEVFIDYRKYENSGFNDFIYEDLDGDGLQEYLPYHGYPVTSSKGAIYADFTGDGKIDILVPDADKSTTWHFYFSKGDSFEKVTLTDFIYYSEKPEVTNAGIHHTSVESGCQYGTYTYYQYMASDLDKDGKAEIIVKKMVLQDHQWSAHYDQESTTLSIDVYSNKDGKFGQGELSYEKTLSKTYNHNQKVIPFDMIRMDKENQQLIVSGSPDDCKHADCNNSYVYAFDFPNVQKLARITAITQGSLRTEIDYKELDPNINEGFYKGSNNLQYPYMELDKVSKSFAVSQLRQEGRKQDFKYRGLVTHLKGRGIIGFRQSARSSWYADGFENAKIWSGAEMDPLNEGLPVKEWSVRTQNDDNLIFPADLSVNNTGLLSLKSTDYQISTPSTGVKAIVPIKTLTKDFLKNITEESSVTYGDYYLPAQTVSTVNSTFATTTAIMSYIHNPAGIGKDYYVGRPASKVITVNAYGDIKSTKEEYTYLDNLVKTMKTYNRDNSGWVQESYNYDNFGNIIEKMVTNSVDTMIQNEKSQYEPKGRFVIKKTDNLGLETNIEHNNWGQITKQTDPFGNILENTYDGWGKLLTSKTNFGGITSYTYEKLSDGSSKVTQLAPDGTPKETYTNKLGQQYKVRTRSFNAGSYASVSTVYDNLGRKINESEPYFDNETPKWNNIIYDDSVLPAIATATAFNGKQMKTSVLGNVTTVEELNGNKRISKKTTDALGNVISSEDRGGVINFSYNAAGEQIKAQYGDNVVTTKYDVWGRKSEFYDPSNGLYKYEYNGFGQIKKEISPGGYKEYFYNDKGQLVNEVEKSNTVGLTDKSIAFTYNSKGQLESKTGTSNGKSYSTTISYDAFGRVKENIEQSNGKVFSQKNIVYDDKSRISSYEKELVSNGIVTKASIENLYDTWSGTLFQMKDKASGKVLWNLQEVNAKGLILKSRLGEVNIVNTYDANNFLSGTIHSSEDNVILECQYVFDAIKNELKERTRQGEFDGTEVFIYDDNNRLVQWTNPKLGRLSSNKYDLQGRIIENDQIGAIQFGNTSKVYQSTSVKLNADGKQNYLNAQTQRIIYNENNDPLYIQGKIGDVRFEYGLSNMRQMATYGGDSAIGNITDLVNSTWEGIFTKYYSEDGSFEITRNNWTGEEKHILYIGGTPYESNVVYLKDYTQSSGSFMFLHKDYLGSILAVSDKYGYKVQEAYFDAWGNRQTGGDINYLDRGYTGHEHFEDIGIIHMNGRLYDPLLRRFLNADENIQDPNNTQNYNKYGYVLNNPLMYNDPNGEFWIAGFFLTWLAPMIFGAIIGAAIGAAMYLAQTFLNGGFNTGGFLKSLLLGGVSGLVTSGLSAVFSLSSFFGTIGVGALTGGVGGGINALFSGSDFMDGVIRGAIFGGVVAGVTWMVSKTVQYYNSKKPNAITENDLKSLGYDINNTGDFNDYYTNDQQVRDDFNRTTGDYQASVKNINTEIKVATKRNLPEGYKLTDPQKQIWSTDPRDNGVVLGLTYGTNRSVVELMVKGYRSEILIAPNLGIQSDILKKAVFGHEYIHAYHRYLGLDLSFNKKTMHIYKGYTESSAYHYSINVLKSGDVSYTSLLRVYNNYGGYFPPKYNWVYAIQKIVNYKK